MTLHRSLQRTRSSLFNFIAGIAIIVIAAGNAAAAEVERSGGPYVPTPQVVVDAMLELAGVGPSDFVIDLGSGDGRIVLTAAQKYRARGVGVDIDPDLVEQSNVEAKKQGVSERVVFRQQDVLHTPIGEATVVTLYLLPGMMRELQAKVIKELKPGTRIVSHDFPFGDWTPDREVSVDVPEKYGTPGQWKSTLFYWIVPAHISGNWQLTAPGLLPQPVVLKLDQRYQTFQGAAAEKDRRVSALAGKVIANRVAFKLTLSNVAYEFHGLVDGNQMAGNVVQGGRTIAWTAEKAGLQ